jgi:flavin reductase (DIM6/NTAB) family NADH-FMN oxidoreductase RutF
MTAVEAGGPLRPVGDGSELKRAYSCFPTGVVAVCCEIEGQPVGLAASSFATVSLDPPLVSFCVDNSSTTWPRLRGAPALGVSVFASSQGAHCRQMAGPAERRFDGLQMQSGPEGALLLSGATASMACTIADEIAAGDHTLIMLRILHLHADPSMEPLVFHASTFRALENR